MILALYNAKVTRATPTCVQEIAPDIDVFGMVGRLHGLKYLGQIGYNCKWIFAC